jgi:hypothetical protein
MAHGASTEVVASGDACFDCRSHLGPLVHDLAVTEAKDVITEGAENSAAPTILFELLEARMELPTVEFNDQPRANQKVNSTHTPNLDLYAGLEPESPEPESGV